MLKDNAETSERLAACSFFVSMLPAGPTLVLAGIDLGKCPETAGGIVIDCTFDEMPAMVSKLNEAAKAGARAFWASFLGQLEAPPVGDQ